MDLLKFRNRIEWVIINRKNESSGGSFGSYYIISQRVGIKLLFGGFDTLEEIKDSHLFRDAEREAELLIQAKKRYYYIPKCYGVVIIWKDNKYKVGIVMQHLEGKLADYI